MARALRGQGVMRLTRPASSPHAPSGHSPRSRRLVRLGFALFAVALFSLLSWLRGDFGNQEPRTARKALAPPYAPNTWLVPIPNSDQPPVEPRASPLTGTENILIAGMDRRPDAKGSGLTDTLVVVVLEKQTGRVGLISIPRDLAVEVPHHGLDRINTVYSMARLHGEDGLVALKQSVGELLALTMDHAIVIDLSVFEKLIDTLGGVTVNVPCPIVDDFVDSRTADGRRVLDVKAGPVRMDGTTAAMYVRSRHGRSDFSRARRQQGVLDGLHREILTLGNLGRLPEVLGTFERGVSTDLKRYELLDLARRALSVHAEQVHAVVISETQVDPLRDRGRAMLTPKLDAIDLAVSNLFTAPTPGTQAGGTVCPPADVALRRRDRSVPSGNPSPDPDAHETADNSGVVASEAARLSPL
jgi:polyisoprenyl-teichoic acid--peptidoglycan teichoic acid transferase